PRPGRLRPRRCGRPRLLARSRARASNRAGRAPPAAWGARRTIAAARAAGHVGGARAWAGSVSPGGLAHAARAQGVHELAPDLGRGLARASLETHDEDGLGVGCAHESPAVAELDARTVDVDDAGAADEGALHLLHDRELAVVGTIEPRLGRALVA